MARLLMLGLSHHAASVEMRERVAIDHATWQVHAPAPFATVLLSTCNRLEVYAWIEGRKDSAVRAILRSLNRASGVPVAEMQPFLACRVGREAVLHLVRVASGLDSLLVGEEQIRGQVREALRTAEASRQLPAALLGIFQRSLEATRRVRGSTRLGQVPSVAAAGVAVACRQLPGDVRGQRVVVLGAGVMARAAAEALISRGARLRLLNRTPAHAERVFANLPVEIDSLDALPVALAEAALVVSATAARSHVVQLAAVATAMCSRSSRLIVLDIALPRDVDPGVRELSNVTLIDLDDLERLCPVDSSTRHVEEQHAESLAYEEAGGIADWLRFRAATPAIAELRTYAESIRTAELRRSASRLRDLTPEQAAAVEALTSGIVNKLMHGPTVALRDAAGGRGNLGRSHILRVLRPPRTSSARGRSA